MNDPQPTLQQLQDDIDLYETLLASLDDAQPEDLQGVESDKEHYQTRINELKAQMARQRSLSQTGPSIPSQPTVSAPSGLLNAEEPTWQFTTLPSRKRERSQLDDEIDTQHLHKAKSRRSTPPKSPTPSHADSIGSNYFDDPTLNNLLGDSWQEDVRSNRDYFKKQEAKRRQQLEDERLARQLQEEWAGPQEPNFQSQHPRSTGNAPIQHTQTTLRPNGSFNEPPPAFPPVKPIPSSAPAVFRDWNTNSPATVSDSDDDLTFANPNDFYHLFPSSVGPSRHLPPGFGLRTNYPGAYPSSQSAYTSLPGTSVYGSSSQSHQPLSFLNGLPSLSSVPGLDRLGSLTNPFDLERITNSIFGSMSQSPYHRNQDYVDPVETQEEIRQLLHNIRPDEEIDPSEASEHQPQALKARLMPHQVKGLAWMKKMEEGSNKGGILADDMGLGKTIQAIALILSRPPPADAQKPTLVITPVALMDQWRREIIKMVRSSSALSVLILHGSKIDRTWSRIKHYDVILTTYGTLGSELKRKIRWDEKLKLNPDAIKSKSDDCVLMDDKSRFHRIILDEAQNIKNKNTKAAMAACRLQADFRWCLSGTPMQNGVEEIYSLIKFCRIRPYNNVDKFNVDIARPLKAQYQEGQKRAMQKLQALLKALLLRRTKKSTIDGQPILQLPEKHTVETRAIFGPDQSRFYKNLETQSQIQFNKFVRQGTVGRNYSHALVLLLRLRQCCCSPQLVTNSADFTMDSGIAGIDMVANAKELSTEVVARIKEQEDMECPICMDAVDNPIIFNPCGHALCHDCFSRMIDNVHSENADNIKCPHCRASVDSKKITDHDSFLDAHSGHSRKSRLDDTNDNESDDASSDADTGSDEDEVESDGSDDGNDLNDFIVNDDAFTKSDDDSEDEDEDDLDRIKKPKKISVSQSNKLLPTKQTKGKGKKPSKDRKKKKEEKTLAQLRKEGMKSKAAKNKYLRQLRKLYQPCTKIDKTLELLHEIQDRGENEKTIIFSSFTSFLDLIEVPLSQDQKLSRYTRYDGSMTAQDRNQAVLRFIDDPHCRVILVSLKAGNSGLNLTIANHVIILDPFWNPFVEFQAADRCHRIGQQREVTVHRVLIGEEGIDHQANPEHTFTVEDRILQLQAKKRSLVESALDENAASSVSRLGVRELGYLFGVNEMPAITGQ